MVLKNKTKNKIISDKINNCESFVDKLFGLVRNDGSDGILMKTKFGIHTFLMKRKIDVLILDKYKKVVVIKKDLAPNKIFFWNPAFNLVLELEKGLMEKSNTEIGDTLDF